MKKLFKFLTCFALVFTIVLSGCSCVSPTPLTFSSSFLTEQDNLKDFKETVTYDLSYLNGDKNYPYINKSQSVAEYIKDFVIQDGYYKTQLSTIFTSNEKTDLSDLKASGLFKDGDTIFKLITELNHQGQLVLNNDVKHQLADTVTTETYFLEKDHSYAPIYTESSSDMSLITCDTQTLTVGNIVNKSVTVYNKVDYTITTETYSKGSISYNATSAEIENQSTSTTDIDKTTETYEYDLKTLVDNNQLLFILRNFKTQQDTVSLLPVVSPAYGEQKYLNIRQDSAKNIPLTFTYNGNSAQDSETIPVKSLSFAINDVKASGQTQYLTYQTGTSIAETPTVLSRALLIEYAFPMPIYGIMGSLGGLKCSIKSVEINK